MECLGSFILLVVVAGTLVAVLVLPRQEFFYELGLVYFVGELPFAKLLEY